MNLKIVGDLSYFYQWDLDRTIIVEDGGICDQVHFSNGPGEALVCPIKSENGIRFVDVPNILLQKSEVIYAYLYTMAEDGTRTRCSFRFSVSARPRPAEYVYTETETLSYHALLERIKELEEKGVSDEQVAKAVEEYLEENPAGVNFETDDSLNLQDGILSVNTTNDMEKDNTLPITSAGVYATVGNIEALLKTI